MGDISDLEHIDLLINELEITNRLVNRLIDDKNVTEDLSEQEFEIEKHKINTLKKQKETNE